MGIVTGMAFVDALQDGKVGFSRRGENPNDIDFEISGSGSPLIAVTLAAGQALVCDGRSVLMREQQLEHRSGEEGDGVVGQLINATGVGDGRALLACGCSGQAGAFDLMRIGNRLVCPPEAVVGYGPGVKACVYARYRGLAARDGASALTFVMLEGDGWVFLRGFGAVKEVCLEPGVEVCVQANAVAALTATVEFDPEQRAKGAMASARLTGPGRVWLQSDVVSLPASAHSPLAVALHAGGQGRVLNGANGATNGTGPVSETSH